MNVKSRGISRSVAMVISAVQCALPGIVFAAGDATLGSQVFRNCAACHSLEPAMNMTGPSLAGIFGRKAGALPSFHRYSAALKGSGVVWDDQSLDAWIRDPASLVPGNEMAFPGIPNAAARANLIAYLHEATISSQAGATMRGGLPDLKSAPDDAKIKTIGYCGDTYTVVTAAGRTRKFWEFNLRFKTDSSSRGPYSDEPVLVPQGMQGDRAQVVFSQPEEITKFVKGNCPK
ncbi:MAG TPA: cytochrome c family protein [Tepidiformaceae bacterium]|nr:cytochrome c family protein [Tepidiformaceae bacterium]